MTSPFTNSAITNFLELIGLSAATPSANRLRLFVKKIAGKTLLAYIDERSFETTIGPHEAYHKYGYWAAQGNTIVNPSSIGMNSFTTVGVLTSRAVALTNQVTRRRRLGIVSAATAAALASFYQGAAQFSIGDGVTPSGFHAVFKFNISDPAAVAGARMFVGIRSAVSPPTTAEPNALTNSIGLAKLSTSNNLHIVYGGSAAQAAIDLGSNFPANDPTAFYILTLHTTSAINSPVGYLVVREGTAFSASGVLTGAAGVALPANTLLLAAAIWRTNNATALSVAIDVDSVFIGDSA